MEHIDSGIKAPTRFVHGPGYCPVTGIEHTLPTHWEKARVLTTATGCPIGHMKNSLTAGPHGPALLQDTHLIEKLQHFDREKTPPRNVHAHGCGAYGTLRITHDITKYSKASLFSKVGAEIPLFTRFSGVFTEAGESETIRDLRGFALKFYTSEGNWDLLGINTPVFNARDIKVGPDGIHAFKRDPRTNEWNPTQMWDFIINHPESLHQALMIYTDECTPASYRYMRAYGCNTFSFYNENKERFWIKLHLISQQGHTGLRSSVAKMIAGEDPTFLRRDLREAIERGDYPKWRFCFQAMPEKDGYKFPYTFDCTKIWPHDQYPLHDIGIVTLHDNPMDYFAEVEQVAFSPANVVPGIGFSPDKLLQGRLFLYDDTQYHRLGPHFKQIPINRPVNAEGNTMYIQGPHQSEVKYKWPAHHPSSFVQKMYPDKQYLDLPTVCDGNGDYYDMPHEGTDEDFYGQTRQFYQEVLDDETRGHLHENLAESLVKVTNETILKEVLRHFSKVSPTLAEKVIELRKDFMAGKFKTVDTMTVWNQVRGELLKKPE